ncbi:MAG TPA: GNAT family N-acetyltransferase [Solirubrobacteraceae bacterium]|nr:GNAT family N-acetyltransferase [Solirubrobacteraceae bacterium]
MTAVVRAARPEELRDVLELLAELNPDDPRLSAAETARTWRRMREQPGRCVLVAVEDGRVIGTADCIVLENLTRSARPYMLVENVVVHADHRRRGTGAGLLRAAVERARSAACYKVQLLADDTPANHRFYESCGLQPTAQGFKQRL